MNKLLQQCCDYVKSISPNLPYHNYEHAKEVMEAVFRIAVKEGCSQREILMLQTAAIFHDCVYQLNAPYETNEKLSGDLAYDYLEYHNHGFDFNSIELHKIALFIFYTAYPYRKSDLNKKLVDILRDADLSCIGTDNYLVRSKALRKEIDCARLLRGLDPTTSKEWTDGMYEFLSSLNYNTKTAKELYNETKEKNTQLIRTLYED